MKNFLCVILGTFLAIFLSLFLTSETTFAIGGGENLESSNQETIDDISINEPASEITPRAFDTTFDVSTLQNCALTEGFHYFLNQNDIRLTDLRSPIKIEKKDSNGNWSESNDLSLYTERIGNRYGVCLRNIPAGDHDYSNYRIIISFAGGVIGVSEGGDVDKYDLTLILTNIKVKNASMSGVELICSAYYDDGNFRFTSFSALRHTDTGVAYHAGVSYDVEFKVTGAKENESLWMPFTDIDLPGYNGRTINTMDDYCESIRLYRNKGWKGNIVSFETVDSRSASNLNSNNDPYFYIYQTNNYLDIVSKTETLPYTNPNYIGNDQKYAGIGFLGNPISTTIRWAGYDCDTIIGLDINDFNYCTLTANIRFMDKNGNYPANNTYTQVKKADLLKGMYNTFYYTYTRPVSESAIWDLESKSVGLGEPPYTTPTKISNDADFYISVPRKKYTYSFDANLPSDASSTVSNMPDAFTKYAEQNVPLKSDWSNGGSNPILTGYRFIGWNTKSDGTGINYDVNYTNVNDNGGILEDKIFYAQWEPAIYIVKYNGNEDINPNHQTGERTQNTVTSVSGMPDSTYTFDVKGTLRTNDFIREGYTFIGWNTASDGSGTSYSDRYDNVLNWTSTSNGVVTLYAQWEKKLGTETLTVVDEETNDPISGVKVQLYKKVNGVWELLSDVKTTNANGQVTISDLHWFDYEWRSVSVPTGYTDMTNVDYSINYNHLEQEDLRVLYLIQYDVETYVRYQQKDGSYTVKSKVDSKKVKYGHAYSYTAPTHPTGDENGVIYKAPTPNPVGDSSITEDETGDKAYLITYDRKTYEYRFHANTPSRTTGTVQNMPDNKSKLAENTPDDPNRIPTLTGYLFKGWFDTSAATGGNAYNPNESMLSDKDFYARWEPIKYYIIYNPNNTSNPDYVTGEFTQNVVKGTMEKSTYTYDIEGSLRKNTFTRTGYIFTGWNTKADGTGTSYVDEYSPIFNWTTENNKEFTLYAQWKKKLGAETITVVSEETGNPVQGVQMKLYREVNGSWEEVPGIGTKTTDENGKVSVINLDWFNYQWRSVRVPAGYQGMKDTRFDIYCTADLEYLSRTNSVILYMKHVTLTLDSVVSDIIKGEQPPAFLYHVSGIDAAGVNHEYDVMVQTDVTKTGKNNVPDLFAGTYTVTQVRVSRYIPDNAVNILNSTVSNTTGTANLLNADEAEIKFPYTIKEYGWFYGVTSKTNSLTK